MQHYVVGSVSRLRTTLDKVASAYSRSPLPSPVALLLPYAHSALRLGTGACPAQSHLSLVSKATSPRESRYLSLWYRPKARPNVRPSIHGMPYSPKRRAGEAAERSSADLELRQT